MCLKHYFHCKMSNETVGVILLYFSSLYFMKVQYMGQECDCIHGIAHQMYISMERKYMSFNGWFGLIYNFHCEVTQEIACSRLVQRCVGASCDVQCDCQLKGIKTIQDFMKPG